VSAPSLDGRARTTVKIGLRILAVCAVFGVCFAIAGTLAGVQRLAPKEASANPADFLLPFAVFCVSVGSAVSYLVLRLRWRGVRLAGVLFAATFGISTVATQVETLFFLSAKMPPGMIRALFVQGAMAMAVFSPLAVFILGKWVGKSRGSSSRATTPEESTEAPPVTAAGITWRIALLVAAFVFLYMFFGYYVAWRNPALREYYGGADVATFFEALQSNWLRQPQMFLLQVFRALLYVACVYPLLRLLPIARWQKAVAISAFLASWTTALLLPNSLMPAAVARSHLWETLAFNVSFGALMAWLVGF
jgi:hypothetical protein